jgi:plastocyanin
MFFTPGNQSARVGDTISWLNTGTIPHTVTAPDKAFDKTIAPGERFNHVLRKEGTVNYVCTFHPGMKGTLTVGPPLKNVTLPPAAGTGADPAAAPTVERHGSTSTYYVLAKDGSYSPASVAAHVGDTLVFLNVGSVAHTVYAKDGRFSTKLAPGKRFSYLLDREGTLRFGCKEHKAMFGSVQVGPAVGHHHSGSGTPLTLGRISPVAAGLVGSTWLAGILLLLVLQLKARGLHPGRRLHPAQ